MMDRVHQWFNGIGKCNYLPHLSIHEREKITRDAWKSAIIGHPRLRLVRIVIIIMFFATMVSGMVANFYLAMDSHFLLSVLFDGLKLLSIALFIFVTLRIRKHSRFEMHQYCLDHNIRPKQCFLCNYDLRQIDSLSCPECGSKLASGIPGKENHA